MPKKPIDVLAMFPAVKQIKDGKLRTAVIEIWEELWQRSEWNDIGDVPTSNEMSYPNLPHMQCVVTIALAVADAFEQHHGLKVNRDYLIAAAVLQDASKVVERAPGEKRKSMRATEIGKYYPHGFVTAMLSVQKGIPEEVGHVMLTHSSSAAKFPDTLEGKILYYCDQLDVIAIYKDRWKKHLMIAK